MSTNYDLKSSSAAAVVAPTHDYGPPTPKHYRPKIGLIACGGITEHHCKAYRASGYDVVAFYDKNVSRAEARRNEFYPQARVCQSEAELLGLPEIEVVDIATHPDIRSPIIEHAIKAGKHVLSQKPFVLDLAEGARLVELAKRHGVKLAVNQNGRWAPYFSYLRKVVQSGLIGQVSSVQMTLSWDHTWTAGTAFEKVHHLLLYDFGIHWFDAAYALFGGAKPLSVFATITPAVGQPIKPPLVGTSLVTFETGIATLSFNGCTRFGGQESCTVIGTQGALRGNGNVCSVPAIEITTSAGKATKELTGSWFPDGFRGTMGELLCAIEENREPENSAEDNLKSLAICFGAMKSADEGRVIRL